MSIGRATAHLIALASLATVACAGDGATNPDGSSNGRFEITFGYAAGADILASSMDLFQLTQDGPRRSPFLSTAGVETDPEWSNDGKQLVFTSYVPSIPYVPSLWAVNVDLTGLHRIVVDTAPLPGTNNRQMYGSWSPDGASIAFRREINVPATSLIDDNSQTGIAVMGGDGSAVRWLAPGGDAPSWSVSNRIAFGKDGFIWTVNPDGSGLVRVTSVGGDMYPRWSRDGTTLVFRHVTTPSIGGIRRFDLDVVTVRADGSDRRTLVTGQDAVSVSWSADGAYVLFEQQDSGDPAAPKCTLRRIPATGGASVNLTPDRDVGYCGGASWRPM